MYRQDCDKSSPLKDFILVMLVLAAIFAAGYVMKLFDNFLGANVTQYILFGAVALLCVLTYTLRISTFSYTFYFKQPEPYMDEAFCTLVTPKLPEEIGTFIVQKGVADKGKVIERVTRSELRAVLAPGEAYDACCENVKHHRYSRKKKSALHTLVFERDGVIHMAMFDPDERMEELLQSMINGTLETDECNAAAEKAADGERLEQ